MNRALARGGAATPHDSRVGGGGTAVFHEDQSAGGDGPVPAEAGPRLEEPAVVKVEEIEASASKGNLRLTTGTTRHAHARPLKQSFNNWSDAIAARIADAA